jgi:hypothetical protein
VKQFAKYGISAFCTPMDDRAQNFKTQMPKAGSAKALQVAAFKYRELIGTHLWISNVTQPDIVFAVNTLAMCTCNPGLVHWKAALKILGYLHATKNYCIRYAQQHFQESIVSGGYMRGRLSITTDFDCYVNASHAADIDTRRRTTGYVLTGEPF